MVFPEAIASNLLPVIDKINGVLIVGIPVALLIVAWLSIAISHRFVGPIERLDADLEKILAGDRGHRVRLRKNDDLKSVAEKINQLLDRFNG